MCALFYLVVFSDIPFVRLQQLRRSRTADTSERPRQAVAPFQGTGMPVSLPEGPTLAEEIAQELEGSVARTSLNNGSGNENVAGNPESEI